MFKKEVIEKTIEELLRNTISVQNLDMRFCVEWLEDHRNTKRVFWPEKFGIIAPFEKNLCRVLWAMDLTVISLLIIWLYSLTQI